MLPVIRMFDSLRPTPNIFVTPITVAAFLSIMRDGDKAVEFWRSYSSGIWEENSAMAAIDFYIKNLAQWGKRADNIHVAGICLFLYNIWARNPTKFVNLRVLKDKNGETIIKAFKASL
jgi:hypothetical protein